MMIKTLNLDYSFFPKKQILYKNYVFMGRRYFSDRQGQTPNLISLEDFREIVRIQHAKFNQEGYFQRRFGYDCVDIGYVAGDASINMEEQLLITFGSRGKSLSPTTDDFKNLDLFSLFDLIEFLYDHIAKPVHSTHHRWDDCGIHVSEANYDLGKCEWREELNKHLPYLETPHTLTDKGNIEELPSSEGLKNLVQNPISHDSPETIDNRINHACALFLKGNATLNEKRDALNNLAAVLELLKNDLKSYVPNDEENRLFEIANTFGIRHHNDQQQTDYNRGVYYYWIFYCYLTTIDLLARLKKEQ